jgi:hypothetical protein
MFVIANMFSGSHLCPYPWAQNSENLCWTNKRGGGISQLLDTNVHDSCEEIALL